MKHIVLKILFCLSFSLLAGEETTKMTQQQENQEMVNQPEQSIDQTTVTSETTNQTEEQPVMTEEKEPETAEKPVATPIQETVTEEEITQDVTPQENTITVHETVEKEQSPVIDTVLPSQEMILDEVPYLPSEIMADNFDQSDIEEAHIAGVDTANLEEGQGNWLFKRMWWERAQETYQKLKAHIDKITELRADFFTRRSTLDKELFDAFYLTLGMGISEFTTILRELKRWVSSEQPEGEVLSEEKQHILDKLKMEHETIEQVVSHVDQLKQIDNAIENSLGIIIEVINSSRRFEHEGWEYFKEIGIVLSEKKARELFYKLDIALQNVKQLSSYLERSFSSYFTKLEDRARQTVSFLQSQLKLLKEKEIELKENVDELNRKVDIQQKEEIEELEDEIIKKSLSWWESITGSISSFFKTIRSLLPW